MRDHSMKHLTLGHGHTYSSAWAEGMDLLLQRESMLSEASLPAPLKNKKTLFRWFLPKIWRWENKILYAILATMNFMWAPDSRTLGNLGIVPLQRKEVDCWEEEGGQTCVSWDLTTTEIQSSPSFLHLVFISVKFSLCSSQRFSTVEDSNTKGLICQNAIIHPV